jgi:hypothetical protein
MRQTVIERRHQLDPLERPGPVCAIEYPLPCQGMPVRSRKRLDPWLASCIGCSPRDVRSRLKARWSDLPGTGIRQ